ncbi:MAG: glycosyltransferase family 4 protein [Rikenellaceae bacterium]
MAKITFLLPGGAGRVVGGIKVILEHANRLVADGYSVYVVLPTTLCWGESSLKERYRAIVRTLSALVAPQRHYPHRWFEVDNRVHFVVVPSLSEWCVPSSDIYVATSVETAEYLAMYRNVDRHHKLYYIQAYEDWNVGEERLLRSYSLPLRKVTIAEWLKEIVEFTGNRAEIIENGFNFDEFRTIVPPERRSRGSVAMLYHILPVKGCADGIEALKLVKQLYPQLRAQLFGVVTPREPLPEWMEFYHAPTVAQLVDIYNSSSVFLATSHHEGWGLTVGEAMICSAAVVCTSCGGYRQMAEDGITALVAPIKSPKALADHVMRLIEDDQLRWDIARRGNRNIERFTWEVAYFKFRSIIKNIENQQ